MEEEKKANKILTILVVQWLIYVLLATLFWLKLMMEKKICLFCNYTMLFLFFVDDIGKQAWWQANNHRCQMRETYNISKIFWTKKRGWLAHNHWTEKIFCCQRLCQRQSHLLFTSFSEKQKFFFLMNHLSNVSWVSQSVSHFSLTE